MRISKGRDVKVEFTLKNQAGVTLEASTPSDPLRYVHGDGTLLESFERHLESKKAGDEVSFVLNPQDAFGERDESRIIEAPKNELGLEAAPQKGMKLNLRGPDGATLPVVVTKVKLDTVVLDANHIYAGMTLHFKGKILNVRKSKKAQTNDCCNNCDC